MENTTVLSLESNRAQIFGEISDDKIESFESNGETFYEIKINVSRLSGVVDKIPVTISKNLIESQKFEMKKGNKIALCGEFRSRNFQEDGKSHLILTLFAKEILSSENINDKETNKIFLSGFLCKKPSYRDTPFGRQICDILLAVNRPHKKKSDYIPCIIWGRNAVFVKDLEVGTKINLTGRIQSRIYTKNHEDGTTSEHTAYEISVNNFKIEKQSDDVKVEA